MIFSKPSNEENLELLAYNALLIRYKNNPTSELSKQILKYCPNEKWRITIVEVICDKSTNVNFCSSNIGKVIGKRGCNLRNIENETNTNIKFIKTTNSFIIKKKRNVDGDIWTAVDLIEQGLKQQIEKKYTDWERYYLWWYYFNKKK